QYGTVGGHACKKNGNPSSCKGTFDVQQQAFSATSDDSGPNSGAISRVQIGELGGSTFGADSFVQGSSHNLVITVDVKGLANSTPRHPPTTTRHHHPASKRT